MLRYRVTADLTIAEHIALDIALTCEARRERDHAAFSAPLDANLAASHQSRADELERIRDLFHAEFVDVETA